MAQASKRLLKKTEWPLINADERGFRTGKCSVFHPRSSAFICGQYVLVFFSNLFKPVSLHQESFGRCSVRTRACRVDTRGGAKNNIHNLRPPDPSLYFAASFRPADKLSKFKIALNTRK